MSFEPRPSFTFISSFIKKTKKPEPVRDAGKGFFVSTIFTLKKER